MRLSLIVAVGRNGEIGRGGGLPWPRLREDMAWFVKATMGKPIIMGRKTWESLAGPLIGRHNIVLSRTWPGEPGCDVVKSPDAATRAARRVVRGADPEAVVIGGAGVYAALAGLVGRAYVTRVDGVFPEADTFFPIAFGAGWSGRIVALRETCEVGCRLEFVVCERELAGKG